MNKVFIYQCSWQEKEMPIFCQANLSMRPPSAVLIYLYFFSLLPVIMTPALNVLLTLLLPMQGDSPCTHSL